MTNSKVSPEQLYTAITEYRYRATKVANPQTYSVVTDLATLNSTPAAPYLPELQAISDTIKQMEGHLDTISSLAANDSIMFNKMFIEKCFNQLKNHCNDMTQIPVGHDDLSDVMLGIHGLENIHTVVADYHTMELVWKKSGSILLKRINTLQEDLVLHFATLACKLSTKVDLSEYSCIFQGSFANAYLLPEAELIKSLSGEKGGKLNKATVAEEINLFRGSLDKIKKVITHSSALALTPETKVLADLQAAINANDDVAIATAVDKCLVPMVESIVSTAAKLTVDKDGVVVEEKQKPVASTSKTSKVTTPSAPKVNVKADKVAEEKQKPVASTSNAAPKPVASAPKVNVKADKVAEEKQKSVASTSKTSKAPAASASKSGSTLNLAKSQAVSKAPAKVGTKLGK